MLEAALREQLSLCLESDRGQKRSGLLVFLWHPNDRASIGRHLIQQSKSQSLASKIGMRAKRKHLRESIFDLVNDITGPHTATASDVAHGEHKAMTVKAHVVVEVLFAPAKKFIA